MLELCRKVVHFLSALLVLFFINYLPFEYAVGMIATGIFFSITAAMMRRRGKWKFVDFFERPGANMKGAVTLLTGSLLTLTIFGPKTAVPAIAVLAVSDALATLVGFYFGKRKVHRNKTAEGSTTFFVSALITLLYFYPLGVAAAVAVAATIAELFLPIDDNLTVPITVAVVVNLI